MPVETIAANTAAHRVGRPLCFMKALPERDGARQPSGVYGARMQGVTGLYARTDESSRPLPRHVIAVAARGYNRRVLTALSRLVVLVAAASVLIQAQDRKQLIAHRGASGY